MAKIYTLDQAFKKCSADGMFVPHVIDTAKIESMLMIADEDVLSINDLRLKERWNTLYKLQYDVLHSLAEAMILLDGMKSANHQCLFAWVCAKCPHLELDWNFFEAFRIKRNGIHYHGRQIVCEDCKETELQWNLYINTLKKEIVSRLKEMPAC